MKEQIAGRLEQARTLRRRSIRSLQQELEEAGVSGSSYPNVHAYMKGRTQQSVEFLDAAAKALQVNVEWLVFDKGPMTDEHAAEAGAADHQLADSFLAHVVDTVAAGFGEGAARVLMPGIRRSTVVQTWAAIHRSAVGWKLLHDPASEGVGASLGRALRAQFAELRVDLDDDVSEADLTEYVVLTCAAIRQLAAKPAPKTKSIRPEGDRRPIVAAESPPPLYEEEAPRGEEA